ncbi:MAG: hypothetical protein HN601_02495 [Candidatus Marinimicrobia bacterium]|nr:hypothetical protein [Candidatus Neomarinimicrobiota bacterium]
MLSLLTTIIFVPLIKAYTQLQWISFIFSIIFFVWLIIVNNKYLRYGIPLLFSLLLIINIHYQFLAMPNKAKKYLPAIERSSDLKYLDGLKIAEFARLNTKSNDIFITPPNFGSFRTVANRAIIVDLQCFSFRSDRMVEWWDRVNDCYGPINPTASIIQKSDQLYKNYYTINDSKIEYLSNKYNANYAILHSNTQSSFPFIYDDGKYKLINLSN